MFEDKELTAKVIKLEEIIKTLCPHKIVKQEHCRFMGKHFVCELCGETIYSEGALSRGTRIKTDKFVFRKPKR